MPVSPQSCEGGEEKEEEEEEKKRADAVAVFGRCLRSTGTGAAVDTCTHVSLRCFYGPLYLTVTCSILSGLRSIFMGFLVFCASWYDSGYIFTSVYQGVGDFTDFSVRANPDLEVRSGLWINSTRFLREGGLGFRSEALGRVSLIFMMKVDSHSEADSPGVQRVMGWVRFLQHFAAFFDSVRMDVSAFFSALDDEEFFTVDVCGVS